MTTYTFPSIVPATNTFELVSNTRTFQSPLTNSVQTISRKGSLWKVSMQFNNLTGTDRAIMQAFLTKLNGQQHRFYFANTHAPFLMQAGIRDLIHLWKFQHQPQLSPLLASLFIRAMSPTPPSPSPLLLVPIPTQWRRQLQRGFDHTRVLAQAIAATYPHSLTVKPWLRHTRSGATQHRLNRSARWHNQHERFAVNARIQGCRVVLLDDVMTTGATVNAAAAACLKAGAKQVKVWCFARTPEPGSPLTRYHGGLCNGEAHHEPSLRKPNAR